MVFYLQLQNLFSLNGIIEFKCVVDLLTWIITGSNNNHPEIFIVTVVHFNKIVHCVYVDVALYIPWTFCKIFNFHFLYNDLRYAFFCTYFRISFLLLLFSLYFSTMEFHSRFEILPFLESLYSRLLCSVSSPILICEFFCKRNFFSSKPYFYRKKSFNYYLCSFFLHHLMSFYSIVISVIDASIIHVILVT